MACDILAENGKSVRLAKLFGCAMLEVLDNKLVRSGEDGRHSRPMKLERKHRENSRYEEYPQKTTN